MKRNAVMVVGLLLAVAPVRADDLVITSFGQNGEVTWTYPTNGVREYRVEWCSDLTKGLWCDLEGGLRGIAPTGGTMTTSVPMSYRIKAIGPEPTNMAYIPAGWFDMGDTFGEGGGEELPVHSVYVSGFYMDRYTVSKAQWDEVYAYATNNSYVFSSSASGKATNHPVQGVDWYDCVKWANARSEMESLTPCYYTSSATTTAYRSGVLSVSNDWVRWDADGYRLPTEAEWEKAARGGASGHRFPWADDTISFGRANYYSFWIADSPFYSYDLAYTDGVHPDFDSGASPGTSPVGAFTANGYGLYDMAGNVYEWCWDCYGSSYYASSPEADPHGPGSASVRVLRGGCWDNFATVCRVANRYDDSPDGEGDYIGFRLVRAAQ